MPPAHAALCRQQELCAALEEELSTARQENEALLPSDALGGGAAVAAVTEGRLLGSCPLSPREAVTHRENLSPRLAPDGDNAFGSIKNFPSGISISIGILSRLILNQKCSQASPSQEIQEKDGINYFIPPGGGGRGGAGFPIGSLTAMESFFYGI